MGWKSPLSLCSYSTVYHAKVSNEKLVHLKKKQFYMEKLYISSIKYIQIQDALNKAFSCAFLFPLLMTFLEMS